MHRNARGCFFASTFVSSVGLVLIACMFFLLWQHTYEEVTAIEAAQSSAQKQSQQSESATNQVVRSPSNRLYVNQKRWLLVICMYLAFGLCLSVVGTVFICIAVVHSRRFTCNSVESARLKPFERKHVWQEEPSAPSNGD
jgi:Na+/melibiose symporter-like transporter